MSDSFGAIANLLSCPDDGNSLRHIPGAFVCAGCGRQFPIHARNLTEILPSHPYELPSTANPAYRASYLEAFEQRLKLDEKSFAWGAEEKVSESWARKRRRQVAMVRPLITQGTSRADSVLCDIAAGAGYYTFAYAPEFHIVLHCDLSVANLNYAWRKAQAQGVGNILFLRTDYFVPPFRHSLDRILCLDTLIRGEDHESAVLRAIASALKPSGSAVVDFHNWWHNPLRRLRLLPQNFAENHSYGKRRARQLLYRSGINSFESFHFYQEFEAGGRQQEMFSRLLAPTRLLFRFDGEGQVYVPSRGCRSDGAIASAFRATES